ncbi:MAG: SAM-dependent methyltransferase, partial [Thermodesulfobacteriota bacterium]|nr:SAM-dependent methyltransferase [Thermodesulfobacteriota bacterium]
ANEVYKHEDFEKRNSKWTRWLDMQIHTPEEFKFFLTEAGYIDIEVFTLSEKNWVTAIARKQ